MNQLIHLLHANTGRQSAALILELSEIATRQSYVTYTFADSNFDHNKPARVSLLESRNLIAADGTTGLRTWEASIHLTCWLSTDIGHLLVKGKRVLELGAGSGLISTFCARYLEPKRIVATDGSEEVVERIKRNMTVNDVNLNLDYGAKRLLWGECLKLADDGPDDFDLILGADIVNISSFLVHLRSLTECRHTTQALSLHCLQQ